MNRTLTGCFLLLLATASMANDPLDSYRASYREGQSLWKQGDECGWGLPFAGAVAKVAAAYPVELAEAQFGKGTGDKVIGNFKPVAKPCNSPEDKVAQSRAADMMFDWGNRLAMMEQLMKKEFWAKGLIETSAGATEIESWRASYQKRLIEQRDQATWETYIQRIQAESAQELALICPERVTHNFKGKRACPKISEALAQGLPLAKVRIDMLEWLSPKLVANNVSYNRGEIGSPLKFVDYDNFSTLLNANLSILQCGLAEIVIFPEAHKPNPDGTLTAIVRKFKVDGQYGMVKLKKQANGFNYSLVEADASAKNFGVRSGEFRSCTESAK